MSRMFPFITVPDWNPLGGKCSHRCSYCWAQGPKGLVNYYKMRKYQGEPRIVESELLRRFEVDDFVFVCDMCDLFAESVPEKMILRILGVIENNSQARFLLMTKNPSRYDQFVKHWQIPSNAVLGVTVETNRSHFCENNPRISYSDISEACPPKTRLLAMENLLLGQLINKGFVRHFFISIEPILDFNLDGPTPRDNFAEYIIELQPWAVAVGYDNYNNHLPEPPLEKTMQLIERLEKNGITVFRKTLRERWNGL